MSLLRRWADWLPFRKKPWHPARMVLYTRVGCHLCEDVWAELQRQQSRYGFRLESIDIDGDPDLAAKYGETVPVVMVDGVLRFRGQVNAALLRRLLEARS